MKNISTVLDQRSPSVFRSLLCVSMLVVCYPAQHGAARADEGMWLINRPPVKLLKERYGFEPAPGWLEHVQKSCVRFGRGGSASLVSAHGLVMTNHHVGSGQLERLSTAERNLLETGFYARTQEEELACKGLEVSILWSIDDVTKRVQETIKPGMSAAEANAARRRQTAVIEQECKDATGLQCHVVTLYQGARYHLYRYRRYSDVRLVMAPEQQIAFFGGDTDNFEYPRFDLDVCFFRIYEDGKPLQPEHFLTWSDGGAADGDLTLIAGHPGRTQRLYTVDHLKFLRDVSYPTILQRLWRREIQLNTFAGRNQENARIASGDLDGCQNSRKAFTGMLAGLHDPEVMHGKAVEELKLRRVVEENPEYKSKWGDAWDDITAAQKRHREFYPRYSALERRRAVIGSGLFRIAGHLVLLAEEKLKPSADRLEEYRDSELDSLYLSLYSPAPIYDELEIDRLASGLSYLAEAFGGDDFLVVKALAGKSPQMRAAELVRGTKLQDIAIRKRLAEGGTQAIAESADPMVRFAMDLTPEMRVLRQRYEDEVEGVERQAYAKIAAAQFAINGEDMAPDASGTLRLSFGRIAGYQEAGRDVPSFTTFAGLYLRHQDRGGKPPFDLPPRWIERKSELDLATPFNFVSTADIIGGNSGSPVINRAGEVIGLVFDGNMQGLVWDTVYTDKQARSVCLDTQAIIEALRKIYGAGTLADEIQQKYK